LAKGREEAAAEAEASRERRVADLLQTISREFSTLFAAEDLRNAQYEAESVRLTLATLQRLFPAMNQKYGLSEIQRVITEVLESQREMAVIKMEVHPDYVETIHEHVKRVLKQANISGNCTVTGNQTLGPGDCRMNWENGGAIRESSAVAEDIERHMQVILAERPRLRDNKRSEAPTEHLPAPPPETIEDDQAAPQGEQE
jgi:flagellar assembly protein FliH